MSFPASNIQRTQGCTQCGALHHKYPDQQESLTVQHATDDLTQVPNADTIDVLNIKDVVGGVILNRFVATCHIPNHNRYEQFWLTISYL